MGFSKLDTLEGSPGFIKKFVKSYGKTNDDILAADATETTASNKVAHQGWTIPAGGNDNPNAMRETIIAMNIGSDIGTDDDAGLGIGGGGGGGGAPTSGTSIFDISAVPTWTNPGEVGLLPNGKAKLVAYYGMGGTVVDVVMDMVTMLYYFEISYGTGLDGYNPLSLSDFNAGFAGLSEGDNVKLQSGTTVGDVDDGWNFDMNLTVGARDGNLGIQPNHSPHPLMSFEIEMAQLADGTWNLVALQKWFGLQGQSPSGSQTYYNTTKGFGITYA